MDEYVYTGDDDILAGENEISEGEVFEEKDMNKKIVIEGRERKRVQLMLKLLILKRKH